MKSDFWNEDRVNILTTNWPTRSGADIAQELGTTRNTVIGKAHRLKLAPKPRRKAAAPRKPRRRPTTHALPAAVSVPPEPILPPQPVEGGVAIMDLQEHHCRAIVGSGDDGLARYCGAPKAGKLQARAGRFVSAYCGDHSAKFYQLGLPAR